MQRRTFLKLAPTMPVPMVLARAGQTRTDLDPPALQSWEAVRARFPLKATRAYLNTGGLGPPSRQVLEAVSRQELRQAEDGEHHRNLVDGLRPEVAAFFGAEAEEIAFTRNTTEGNSIIAGGLDLRPGDEVIFESHAHPGGSFPWLNRQKRENIRVKVFDPEPASPGANLERIFDQVTPRTRVIQVSHLTAPTGLRFDLYAIGREARRRGIWFHVDGAQSAGQVPLDLHAIPCDSYAICGHKWLNGPQGTGVLYLRKNRIDAVACTHAGPYTSSDYELPDHFEYSAGAVRHEYGTRNAAGVVGLVEALRLQETIGRKRIADYGKSLASRLRHRLEPLSGVEVLTPEDPDMSGAMLTFRIAGKTCRDIASYLAEQHQLRTRVVTEQDLNAVRTSWHVYNNMDEVERVADGVEGFLRRA